MKEIASYFDDDIDSCFLLLSVASIFKEQQQHFFVCVFTRSFVLKNFLSRDENR